MVNGHINQLMDAVSKELYPLVIGYTLQSLMQQPKMLLQLYEAAEEHQRKLSEESVVESLFDTVFMETEGLMY